MSVSHYVSEATAREFYNNVPDDVAGDFVSTPWPQRNVATICEDVLNEVLNGPSKSVGEPGSVENYQFFDNVVYEEGIGTDDVVRSAVVAVVSMVSDLIYREGGLAATSSVMTAVAVSGHVQSALNDINDPRQVGAIIGPLALSAGYIIASGVDSSDDVRDYIEAVDNINIGIDIFGSLDACVSAELARHCLVAILVFVDAIAPMIGFEAPEEFDSWKIDKETIVLLINDSMEAAEQAINEIDSNQELLDELRAAESESDDDDEVIRIVEDDIDEDEMLP